MCLNIIITGASRGIGRAVALEFAQRSAKAEDDKDRYNIFINCVKNEAMLREVKQAVNDMGIRCEMFTGDISDYNTALRMFDEAHRLFGSVDILVNNAGISMIGLFQDLSRDDWERIMNVNVGSVYNCCHFAIPDMVSKKRGKIINISSVWGNTGASCEAAYSASKGAVNSLTKALAKELAPSGISVNAVACGAIDTDMNAFLSEEERNLLLEEIPAGRMGLPSEAARIVLQLAESPSYLTGQILTLDGGWT
jgi:3-oxoacyl-[acyl-carrier protein] reductase